MSIQKTKPSKFDIKNKKSDTGWLYTKTVKDHFFHPRNVQLSEPRREEFNGVGIVGSPVCGDMMTIWIKVDSKTERIKKCAWRTFGCASAIASTSMLSVMVTKRGGMTLAAAAKLTPKDILKELGGLPPRKIHCSVLGDQALRAAIQNYKKRNYKFL